MRIRSFSEKDKIPVKHLVTQTLAEFGWKPDPKYDYDLDDPGKFYCNDRDRFWILEDDCQLIGTIAVKDLGDNKADLGKFFIKKPFRGKELGMKLMDYAINYCRSQNFNSIKIITDESLVVANALYRQKGFITINRPETGILELQLQLSES